MGTISWFWVPVINLVMQGSVIGLDTATAGSNMRVNGATFTLEDICGAVRFLMEQGILMVQNHELGVPPGGNGNLYMSPAAQDRLLYTLGSCTATVQIFRQVNDWIWHLYCREVTYKRYKVSESCLNSGF